eukprot:1196350-Prorocentrum_minimum.AAC.3
MNFHSNTRSTRPQRSTGSTEVYGCGYRTLGTQNVWIAGKDGIVLFSRNNGATWTEQLSSIDADVANWNDIEVKDKLMNLVKSKHVGRTQNDLHTLAWLCAYNRLPTHQCLLTNGGAGGTRRYQYHVGAGGGRRQGYVLERQGHIVGGKGCTENKRQPIRS